MLTQTLPRTSHGVEYAHHRHAALCQCISYHMDFLLYAFLIICVSYYKHAMVDAVLVHHHEHVLQGWQASMPWDTNPLYAIMHESIYCNSGSCNWAAHRIREVRPSCVHLYINAIPCMMHFVFASIWGCSTIKLCNRVGSEPQLSMPSRLACCYHSMAHG